MAQINQINLGGLSNVDLQAKEQALQRQQAITDALRKMALTPSEQQVVGNRVVPTGLGEGLSKLGQAWIANKSDQINQAQQQDIGNEAAKRSAAALRAMAPPGTFADAPSSTSPPMSEVPSGTPQQGQASPQPVPDAIKQGWIRALSVYQTDPELGKKLIENMATVTNEQKNMAATGQDPRLMGALQQAAARKAATLTMQPNDTNIDLMTGNKTVAPDFSKGTQGGFDAQGNPIMGDIPGNQVIAQLAGQQAGAIEGAKLPYQAPTQVNTPQGPRLMTPAQQIAAANGQGGLPLQTPQAQKFVDARAADAAKEFEGINNRVRTSTQLITNVAEARQALKEFNAGGGTEIRSKIAKMAQAVGMPNNAVDKIAGGNLGAIQEFEKIAAQQAMESLKSSLATDTSSGGRILQTEFELFRKANPNLDTDPRAIEKVYTFLENQHAKNLREQQESSNYLKKGGDPAEWGVEWSKRLTQPSTVPTVTSQAEFDALKSGQEFIEDGKRYRKP